MNIKRIFEAWNRMPMDMEVIAYRISQNHDLIISQEIIKEIIVVALI